MADTTPTGAISIEALAKRFDTVQALDGVDLEVASGESLAVFGPNGAGKTTLIRILSLGLGPSGGSFRVAGLDPRKHDRMIRQSIGVISHQTFLYDDLSARQNLEFFAGLYGVEHPSRRADDLLDSLGLTHRAEDAVASLSHGMQQRLSLARALVHDPRIVLLDEPFSGLDPRAARMVRTTLERLRSEGRTVLLVTHDLARGLELCERWLILSQGRIVARGHSNEVDPASFEPSYFDLVAGPRA